MSVYGREGDYIRYYEINPDVVRLAKEHFTFLSDCPAKTDVVLGDARVCLERELRAGSQQFDVLCFDAFSGDAIPMHLLTRECFRTYLGHLAPGGLLVVHISNNNVDLAPVVRGLANEFGLEVRSVGSGDDLSKAVQRSDWLILTQNQEFLEDEDAKAHFRPIPSQRRRSSGPTTSAAFTKCCSSAQSTCSIRGHFAVDRRDAARRSHNVHHGRTSYETLVFAAIIANSRSLVKAVNCRRRLRPRIS
ncbi:MAG: fused MFS/spermidine synthase [Pirellulales bacterium]